MNRRTFFSRIGSAVVGCYLAVSIPRIGLSKLAPKIVYRVNPEWVNAPVELASVTHFNPIRIKDYLWHHNEEGTKMVESTPNTGTSRYVFRKPNNEFQKFGFSRFNEIPKGPPETWKPINQFISEVV